MKNLLLWARLLHIYIWNNELKRAKDATCKLALCYHKTEWDACVFFLSTVPRCEQKHWISVQTRCADVKPLWERKRRCGKDESFTLFSNDWFNLIFCVDLFIHLTYKLYLKRIAGISLIINSKAARMSVTMRYTHKFRTWLNITLLYRDLWNTIPWLLQNFSRPGNCCCKISLLFQVFHDRTNPIKVTDARFQSL